MDPLDLAGCGPSAVDPCLAAVDPCAGPACGEPLKDLAELDGDERLRVLAALTARFSASFLRWMRSRGEDALTYPRARVLDVLSTEGPAIMRDIADNLGMTARNMTAIVDALEGAGLVQRVAHPHDRRATLIELTTEGRREATQARAQAAARVGVAFNDLTLEEQQRYAELISRLAATFCE